MARGVRRAEIWTVSACAARFAGNPPTASALAQLPTNGRSAANHAHAQLTAWQSSASSAAALARGQLAKALHVLQAARNRRTKTAQCAPRALQSEIVPLVVAGPGILAVVGE